MHITLNWSYKPIFENMKKDYELKFTGWVFIMAAILLWCGWTFSSHHIGEYVVASDFDAIGQNLWYWIWMYRIHIFGWVTMALALFAFTSITMKNSYRVVMLPGLGMTIIGTMTLAIAAAFYYNFGAWGVGQTMDKAPEQVQEFVNNILPTNQYVTCLIRFGRIFSGTGLVLIGIALIKSKMLPVWLGGFTVLLGLSAVAIILAIPDNFNVYQPLFHLKSLWLIAMGVILLTIKTRFI